MVTERFFTRPICILLNRFPEAGLLFCESQKYYGSLFSNNSERKNCFVLVRELP
jgi:hypothetical protein